MCYPRGLTDSLKQEQQHYRFTTLTACSLDEILRCTTVGRNCMDGECRRSAAERPLKREREREKKGSCEEELKFQRLQGWKKESK